MRFFTRGLLIPIVCLYLPCSAQRINTDSLRKALQQTPADSANILKQLSIMFRLSNDEWEAKMMIGQWAQQKSEQTNFHQGLAKLYYTLGCMELDLYNFSEATAQLTKSIELSERYGLHRQHGLALDVLGQVYKLNHQWDKAVEYARKAIAIHEKHGSVKGLGTAYYNLAGYLLDSGAHDKHNYQLVTPLMDKALFYLRQAADTPLLLLALTGASVPYAGAQRRDSAEKFINEAFAMLEQKGKPAQYAAAYMHKGLMQMLLKDYEKAKSSYLQAESYARQYNEPFYLINAYKGLYNVYDTLRDYQKGLYYAKLYSQKHDSLHDKEKFALAATLENRFQQTKKDNEIEDLNRESEIAAFRRRQLTTFLVAALAGLGILAVLALLLRKNIVQRKKAYHSLEEKNQKIQEQVQQIGKQSKTIARFQSQMNPHFVYNALNNIQGQVLTNDQEKAVGQIQVLAQLMRRTFANSEKEEIPVSEEIAYLEKYVAFEKIVFNGNFDFEVLTRGDLEDVVIPPMMIQPFIENAIKHAQLNKVQDPFIRLTIEAGNKWLGISIEDNGTGFQPKEYVNDRLFHSTQVIKSRLEILFDGKVAENGKELLQIQTVPEINRGTLVRFYLPLNYAH
jgi:two-component system LytT family sensor kinase